jgi:hypothetical protein
VYGVRVASGRARIEYDTNPAKLLKIHLNIPRHKNDNKRIMPPGQHSEATSAANHGGPQAAPDVSTLPTSDQIRTKIDIIRRMKRDGKTIHDVRKEHFKFARQYPKLVDTIMEDQLDTRQLNYILNMFERMRTQEVSFNSASQTVGKTMYEQYMAPNLTPQQRATVQAGMKHLEKASPEVLAREAAKLGQGATTTTRPSGGTTRDDDDRR